MYMLRLHFRSSSRLAEVASSLKRQLTQRHDTLSPQKKVDNICEQIHSAKLLPISCGGVLKFSELGLRITHLRGFTEQAIFLVNFPVNEKLDISCKSRVYFVGFHSVEKNMSFTGIEADSVAIIIHPSALEFLLDAEKLPSAKTVFYNILTRSRRDVCVYATKQVMEKMDFLVLSPFEKLLNLVQSGNKIELHETLPAIEDDLRQSQNMELLFFFLIQNEDCNAIKLLLGIPFVETKKLLDIYMTSLYVNLIRHPNFHFVMQMIEETKQSHNREAWLRNHISFMLAKMEQLLLNCNGRLIVLPQIEKSLSSVPEIDKIFGHKNLITALENEKISGYFFRLPELLFDRDKTSDTKISFGPIFFPESAPGLMLVFKNVTSILENTEYHIFEAVQHQVKAMNEYLENLASQHSDFTKIKLVLCMLFRIKNVQKSQRLLEKLTTALSQEEQLSLIFQHGVIGKNNKIQIGGKSFKNSLNTFTAIQTCDDFILKNFISVVNTKQDQNKQNAAELDGRIFRGVGNIEMKITDSELLRQHLESVLFPDFKSRLQIIPEWGQIRDHLLFHIDADGSLIKGSEKYEGEVTMLRELFLDRLSEPNGFLIKSWDNSHFNWLMQDVISAKMGFEFDWIYFGADKIILIDVG